MDHNSQRIKSLETRIGIVENRLRRAAHTRLITGILTIIAFGLIAGFKELQFQVAFLLLFTAFIWFVRQSIILRKKLEIRRSLLFHYQLQSLREERQFQKIQALKKQYFGVVEYQRWQSRFTSLPQPNAADLNTYGEDGLVELMDHTFSNQGAHQLLQRLSGVDQSEPVATRRTRVKAIENSWSWAKRIQMRVNRAFDYNEIINSLPDQASISTRQITLLLLLWAVFLLSFGIEATWLKWTRPLFVLVNLYMAQSSHALFSKLLRVETQLSDLNRLRLPLKRVIFGLPDSFNADTSKSFFSSLDGIARSTSLLSLASHPILVFLVHLAIPYQPFFAWRADKHIKIFRENLSQILPDLERFEVDLSFASTSSLDGSHEAAEGTVLSFSEMRHPLMSASTCVPNSHFFGNNHVMVLTGSNMAGKSTFMRALGLSQILFQNGAKVFAREFKSPCTRVLTCLQVSDSLRDGTSYFYAELNRIKWILDAGKAAIPSLVLIDEIFKGTNNKERLIGSESVVSQLSQSESFSVVSTHDLELAQIASHMTSVSNHHFRDDIVGDELKFPYKLLEGPSPTTNAVKLMKIRGILEERH